MDLDVDIEEHNILDNPRIKNIFPDLSRVKMEIIEPEDIPTEEYNPNLQIKQEVITSEDGDAACPEASNNIDEPIVSNAGSGVLNTETSNKTPELIQRLNLPQVCNSASHSTNHNEINLPEATVQVTERVLPVAIPLRNKRKSFQTFTPTKGPIIKDLTSTSFTNKIIIGSSEKTNKSASAVIISNKIILGTKVVPKAAEVKKEYLPAVVVVKDWGEILKRNSCFCDSCKILFPTKNTFDAHNTSVHSLLIISKDVAVVDIDYDSDVSRYSGNQSVRSNRQIPKATNISKISYEGFRNSTKDMPSTSILDKVSGQQCYHCNKFFTNNSALIKHLYTLLPDKNKRDVDKVKSLSTAVFKCQICNETLYNETLAKFHMKYMHPNESDAILNTVNTNIKFKEVPKVINRAKVKDKATNVKIVVSEDFLLKKRNLFFRFTRNIIKNPPVPISVVFKCERCDLHYIHAKPCLEHYLHHSSRGASKKRGKICKKCKRRFRECDTVMHELQHSVTKAFKVYTIATSLVRRLLCRCPRCNLCFDERAFWEHLKSACVKKSIYCKKCNLHINRETFMKTPHVSCGNNVIIDYFDDVNDSKGRRQSAQPAEDKRTYYRLSYCELCKKCSHVEPTSHICKVEENSMCQMCGLYFSRTSLLRHAEFHLETELNLHTLLLHSMQTNKFVVPRFPNYKFCTICKVHYLNNHLQCSPYKVCEVCSKRFETVHYEVHKQFHTYNLDKVIRGTIHNGGYVGFRTRVYAYQCVHCELFVSDYDNAVRHAHGHIQRKRITKRNCFKCDRVFDSNSIKGHNHSIAKTKIFKFDYKALASDAWFNQFDGVDQVHLGIILMDSVFKDTRILDMTFVQKGDTEMRIYVCSSCNVVVEKTALEKHASSKQYCWDNRKYQCNICDLYFYSPGTIEAHKKLHFNGVKKEDFCVISINNKDESDVAILLEKFTDGREIIPSKPLLERKLQDKINAWTNKDLAKQSDDSEIDNEDDNSQMNYDATMQEKPDVKLVELYKCMKCNVCLWYRKRLHLHHCRANLIQYCNECKQYYYKSKFKKHNRIIHNDGKTIKFKFNCFQTKSGHNRRKVFVVKVVNLIYEKKKLMYDNRKYNEISSNKSSVNVNNIDAINSGTVKGDDMETSEITESQRKVNATNQIVNNKSNEGITLYKCVNCKVCYLTDRNLSTHICSIDFYKRFCDICQQVFTVNNWNRHKKIHKAASKSNLHIHYYKPDKVAYAGRALKRLKENTHIRKDETTEKATESDVDNTKEHPDESIDEVERTDDERDKNIKLKIFQCIRCSICNLSRKTAMVHTCPTKSRRRFCHLCKKYYTFNTYYIHKNVHCKSRNLQLEYFTPGKLKPLVSEVDVSAYSKNITLVNRRTLADDAQLAGESKKNINEKRKTVFKCMNCQICFFKRTQYHRCHKDKRLCDSCNLYFPVHHFSRHLMWHQENINVGLIVRGFRPLNLHHPISVENVTTDQNKEAYAPFKNKTANTDDDENSELDDTDGDHEDSKSYNDVKEIKVYKCVNCNTCIFACSNLYRHVCSSEACKKFCKRCRQWYGPNSWNKHNSLHREYKNIRLTVQYYQPKSINYGKRQKNLIAVSSLVTDKETAVYKPEGIDEELDGSKIKLTEIGNNDAESNRDDSYRLYECDHCSLHFLSHASRDSHIKRSDSHKTLIQEQCSHCNLKFSSVTLKTHQPECPFLDRRGHITIFDIDRNIKTIHKWADSGDLGSDLADQDKLDNVDCEESIADSDVSIDKKENDIIPTTKVNLIKRSMVFFKCVKCHLCIVRRIGNHSCKGGHGKRFCKVCKQFFTRNRFYLHMRWHKNTLNMKINVIIKYFRPNTVNQKAVLCGIEVIPSNTVVNSSNATSVNDTEPINDDFDEDVDDSDVPESSSNKRKRPISKSSRSYSNDIDYRPSAKLRRIELNKRLVGNLRRRSTKLTEQYDIEETHLTDRENLNIENPNTSNEDNINDLEKNENGSNITNIIQIEPIVKDLEFKNVEDIELSKSNVESNTNSINEEASPVIPEVKLYSCNSCEVYFLEAQCCQSHVINHKRLDTREYIQCKLCLLQFLIVDLHMHMVTHHKVDFNFDNVTVKEYVPNEVKPRVYNLKDKLQSLIISTTCVEAESST